MDLVALILALVVAGAVFLAALLLVPAWLLHRFLCSAHTSARQEMLASAQRCRSEQRLRLVPMGRRS